MSTCQVCRNSADQRVSRAKMHARCCSAHCGHELFAGVRVVDDAVHASAASSIGAAIAAATGRRSDTYIMPMAVAAQIVGALQRIGPKRSAEGAEMPASSQADAPTTIDWISDLPPEVWTAIVQQLRSADLSAFAAASSDAATIARTDIVQAEQFRRNRGPYSAARLYLMDSTSDERRHVLRLAYPNVAEMAMGLLLTFDIELIAQIGADQSYTTLFIKLAQEAGFSTRSLLRSRPIAVPIRSDRTLVVAGQRIHDPREPVMVFACSLVDWHDKRSEIRKSAALFSLHASFRRFISFKNAIMERDDVPCYFNYPHIFDWEIANEFKINPELAGEFVTSLIERGMNVTRPDAGFWLVDFCARQSKKTTDADVDDLIENLPGLAFGSSVRTNGDLSLLQMASMTSVNYGHGESVVEHLIRYLKRQNRLREELCTPVIWGDPAQNTILFLFWDTARRGASAITRAIDSTCGDESIPPTPMRMLNANNETPFEHYVSEIVNESPEFTSIMLDDLMQYFIFLPCARPFAMSKTYHIPILARLPVSAQKYAMQRWWNNQYDAAVLWDNEEFVYYVQYIVVQISKQVYRLDKTTAKLLYFGLAQLKKYGRAEPIIELIRTLLADRIDPRHKFYKLIQ